MILNVQEIRGFQNLPVYEYSLAQQFYSQIYILNNKALIQQQQKNKQLASQSNSDNNIIKILTQRSQNKTNNIKIRLNMGMSIYKDYVDFIPINRRCYKDKSQWQRQFPYLNYLSSNQLRSKQQQFQNDIKKNLNNKLRQKLCQKYDPTLNFIDKMRLYALLLAKGTKVLKNFNNQHRMLHLLAQCEYYLATNNSLVKNVSVSLLNKEKISLQTISYTMKGLYCPICFIYDCPIHEKHDVAQNQTPNILFVSKKNKKQKSDHVAAFIEMLNFDNYQTQKQKQPCSQSCYLLLKNFQKDPKFHLWLVTAHTSMSDIKKVIMLLGVYVFSFNPCQISKLFPKNQTPCVLIYKYLENQYNPQQRIGIKMQKSEAQMLKNQSTYQKVQAPKILLSIKKKKINSGKSRKKYEDQGICEDVSICFHHYLNKPSIDQYCKSCVCQKRGYCVPACLCSSQCPLMKKGCRCKKSKSCCNTSTCPCFKNKQQCSPILCGKNCSGEQACCMNQQIQQRKTKKLKIGVSKIKGAGLGLFAIERIFKDSLIVLYLSQKIDPFTLQIRDVLRCNNSFYNFDMNGVTLDSKFIGNKSRFINHGQLKMINTEVRIVKSLGQKWIAFFATRDIQPHEQIYFDYDGDGQLAKHHSDKYPFIVPK